MAAIQSARSVGHPHRSNVSVRDCEIQFGIIASIRENNGCFSFHSFRTVPSHDLWQFGIVLFVCLTGSLPWQKAASDDPRYMRYFVWQNSTMVIPIKRTPKLFKLLTSRACKLFRKFLEPIPERRPKNSSDLHKFLDDRWLAKNAEKDMIGNIGNSILA